MSTPKVGDEVRVKSPNGAFVMGGKVTRVEGTSIWFKNANGFVAKASTSKLLPPSTPIGPLKTKDPGKLYIQRWAEEDDE